jgi:hypothetical protein
VYIARPSASTLRFDDDDDDDADDVDDDASDALACE